MTMLPSLTTPDGHELPSMPDIGRWAAFQNERYRLICHRDTGKCTVILVGTGAPGFDYPTLDRAMAHIDQAVLDLNDPFGP